MDKFTMSASLDYQFSEGSGDAEKLLSKSFKGVAYTGIEANGVVVDLANIKLGKEGRVALIDSHETSGLGAILGYANLTTDGSTIYAEGEFTTEQGMKIAEQLSSGVPLELSIGAYADDYELTKEESVINGKSYPKNTAALRGVHIRELSVVVVGADNNTSIANLSLLTIDKDKRAALNDDAELDQSPRKESAMTAEQFEQVLNGVLNPLKAELAENKQLNQQLVEELKIQANLAKAFSEKKEETKVERTPVDELLAGGYLNFAKLRAGV